jgi:pyrroline-5-carboxylate reductase
MKVLVLGAGKMSEALLTGLRITEDLSEWKIYSPSGISAKNLATKLNASFVSDLSEVTSPDLIIVGCKPQQLKELKKTLNGRFRDSLYLSLCAAVSEEDQKCLLGISRLIRCMPNLAVEYRSGVILLSSQSAPSDLIYFQLLFFKLGLSLIVSEPELEELTLLTGSGPALFYEFAQSLASCFNSLTSNQREQLVRHVLQGAALSVTKNSSDLRHLTESVTSKGGVTIAILNYWRNHQFLDLLKEGIRSGLKRSQEIKTTLQN